MSKKLLFIGSLVLAVSLISIPVFATDYSTMTTEELSSLRGTLRDSSNEDRGAFRNEWRERVREMSSEDAKQYRGRPENALADGNGYKSNALNRHRAGNKVRNGSRACDSSQARENRHNGNRGQ